MRIFCNGCSWTWGSELRNREKSKYSTLLAESLNAKVVNIAKSGTSLHRLLRSTYEQCDPTKYDLAVLQFTLAARTEYYVPGMHEYRENRFLRCIPRSPYWPKLLRNTEDHSDYINSYYKTAYTVEMAHTFEFMVFQALQDHFARHNVPVVTMTLNNESVLPFDLKINTSDIPRAEGGHPNELGHRIITKKIENVIKYGNRDYPDAKKIHLHRLNLDHEKILKPISHTDYN